MAEEKKQDQPKSAKEARTESYLEGKEEEGKVTSLRDAWDIGSKAIEEMQIAAEKEEPKPKKEAKKVEKPCKSCPDDKPIDQLTVDDIKWDSIDYTKPDFPIPVKRDNKIEWITNEAEHKEYLSKGVDYTKKTQDLADEKRTLKDQESNLTKIAENLNVMYETMLREGKIKAPEEGKKEEPAKVDTKDIFARFDIDEDLASDSEKKMAMAIVDSENRYSKIEKDSESLKNIMNFMVIRDIGLEARREIEKAKEKYPIEEIKDAEGNDLTWQQFETIFTKKVQSDGSKKRPIPELAAETVKDIYDIQQQQKSKLSAEQVKDDMSPEDFAAKFPGLYEKITKTTTEKAVAEHEKELADLPPSLEHVKSSDVELSKGSKPKEITGVRDAILKGLKDIDLTKTD